MMYTIRFPTESLNELPAATVAEMNAIDQAMIRISSCTRYQMMEKAGAAVSKISKSYTSQVFPSVAVLVGSGLNGGGALVAAKHLASDGATSHIVMAETPDDLKPVCREQYDILRGMCPQRVIVHHWNSAEPEMLSEVRGCDLIIDGLLGYGIRGEPKEPVSAMIQFANDASVPTISVDLPSGLHPDTGTPADPTILACGTVTLAVPKTGLTIPEASPELGDLYLACIGISSDIINQHISRGIFPKTFPEIMHLH